MKNNSEKIETQLKPRLQKQQILSLVRFGEDTSLEFKRVIFKSGRIAGPDKRDIADEISAMANTASGRIIFGVDDKTRKLSPLTIPQLDMLETWLCEICSDIIDPPLTCLIRKVPITDDAGVIVLEVPRSVFVHKGAHGYFTRIGSSKRELKPDALARLFQEKSQSRIVCFDEQVVADAKIEDLNPSLYRAYRTPFSAQNDQEFLRKMHFIAPDDQGYMKPTVGGLLMASEHPEQYLPSAYIQAVAYRGTERTANEQLDARDIYGPLNVQIAEAVRFVNRNMRVFAIKNPGRVDIPQFPLAAVFEAVVNAVAHRDYSIVGAKIRLHMFSDRLELFSPGGLPNALTLDEIPERQFSRNELLCSVISRCKMIEGIEEVTRMTIMDRRGEGVPIILKDGKKFSGKPPKYEVLSGSEVKLTMYSSLIEAEATLDESLDGGVKAAGGGVKAPNGGVKAAGGGVRAPNGGVNGGVKAPNGGVKQQVGGVKVQSGGVKVPSGGVNASESVLLNAIRHNPGKRVPELVKLTGLSKRTIERHLQGKLKGLVVFRGAPKTGGYYKK